MEQRQEFHRDIQLLCLQKWFELIKVGIVGDGQVLHAKARREDAETHIAERHLTIQAMLEFRLNDAVVTVDVKGGRENCNCDDENYDDDENDNSDFAHKSSEKTGTS